MRKFINLVCCLSMGALGSWSFTNSAAACSRIGPVVVSTTCMMATYIVRAQAVEYKKKSQYSWLTNGETDAVVEFKVLEVLKGDSLSNEIELHGYLNEKDDFNDHPVPYRFVRRNGRSGSCYANTYKRNAEYLLFMKKTEDGFTVDIDPLAPVNEQLHSSEDPWVYYIKGLLKGIDAAKK